VDSESETVVANEDELGGGARTGSGPVVPSEGQLGGGRSLDIDDDKAGAETPDLIPQHVMLHGQVDGDGNLIQKINNELEATLFMPGQSVNVTTDWPRCTKCMEIVDPLRIQGKSPNSWRCGFCNSKMVQLSKVFGTWPIPGWCDLPKDDESKYWKDIRHLSKGSLKEKTVTSLACMQIKTESTSFSSEWLPLSVWSTRGFDAKQIELTSTDRDRKRHPRLGMIYKLTLEKDLLESARQKIYQKLLEGADSTKSKKRKAYDVLVSPIHQIEFK